MGLPGLWSVIFVRAVVKDPAGCVVPLPDFGDDAAAFRGDDPLGIPEARISRLYPTAHTLACLRIAAPVARATSQGSLPTCPAQLWSGGFRTRQTAYGIS